ncbi:hypothetical protein [Sphingomonas oryzagri]
MIRSLAMIAIGSIGGSLIGSILFAFTLGAGAIELASSIVFLTLMTMFFTVPATLALLGMQGVLVEHGVEKVRLIAATILAGGISGAALPGMVAGARGALMGGVYGCTSAAMLTLARYLLSKLALEKVI